MKKKLYIHIGYGKTGTTSLQDFLKANNELLKENNILYPFKEHLNHNLLALPFHTQIDIGWKSSLLYYTTLLDEIMKSNCNKIVLVSEIFIAGSKHASRFIGFLADEFDVTIVCVIRNHIQAIESTHLESQKMKDFKILGTDSAWSTFNNSLEFFDYNKMIEPWKNTFGQKAIKAFLYHPEIIGKDIRTYFMKNILNITNNTFLNSLYYDKEFSNTSIHPLLSSLFSKIDYGDDDNYREILGEVLSISQKIKSIKHSLFTPEQKQEIKNFYAESNSIFADTYLTPKEKELLLVP